MDGPSSGLLVADPLSHAAVRRVRTNMSTINLSSVWVALRVNTLQLNFDYSFSFSFSVNGPTLYQVSSTI